jgi:adenosylmethionine-8-amino-7-oxononanoate aminotransferase
MPDVMQAAHDVTSEVVRADLRAVWHPYTQHAIMDAPIEVVRAEGAYLYTRDGRKLFDGISSWWVTAHGHSHPNIAAAIAKQAATLDQVIFTTFTHEPAALLAAELLEVVPHGLSRVFFSDDGSTAVEAAIKMALQYHANRGQTRRLVVALDNAYHGDTFGAMSVSAASVFTAPFESHLFGIARLPDPNHGDTLAAFDALLESRGDELAAVIVEPLLMGSGGMRTYDATVLAGLFERARARDVLCIADEVLTGFGRTGPMFACELAGVSPDILCLSKGITGGTLPLGATLATEEIFTSFLSNDRRRTLFHGHSYTANPIACAAARASLALFDEKSQARRNVIAQVHAERMAKIAAYPAVTNPRVLGTVAAFDLDAGGGYLSPVGRDLAAFALERDVFVRPLGNVVYLLPPYCSTADDLHTAYSVLEQFLLGR